MPSPKWKLVVDIGDVEETVSVPIAAAAPGVAYSASESDNPNERLEDSKEPALLPSTVSSTEAHYEDGAMQHIPPVAAAAASNSVSQHPSAHGARDPRIDDVIALLGEYMPSDPQSHLSTYLSGFMSLRLLLLRPTRTSLEEDAVGTMLQSYSSYLASGRQKSEIAVLLARDYMFLQQQQQQQQQQSVSHHQPSMLNLDNPILQGGAHTQHVSTQSNTTGLSLFGLPSTSSSLQNSPALAPIPIPGSHDSMSIVSN